MKFVAGLVLALSFATVAHAAPPASGVNLAGVWWSQTKIPALRPLDGKPIPFTDAGKAAYEKNRPLIREIESKPPSLHDMRRCLPASVPRVWGSGFPFQIMQMPKEVVIAYERDHIRRFVYLDEKLDAEIADPAYMGSSAGHWDGDTLVIESGAYKTNTFLDETGLPHGDGLRITERIRKTSAKTLEIRATIEDPEMYSQPWSVRYTFAARPDVRIAEYLCGIDVLQTRFGTIGAIPKLKHHGN